MVQWTGGQERDAPADEKAMKQPDMFRSGYSGPELKDRALKRFELRESHWMARARQRMAELYHERLRFPTTAWSRAMTSGCSARRPPTATPA